jgi:hypothetical protein
LFGWRGGVAGIVAGLAISFVLFGYAVIYWRNADMDFMVICNALVMNDGKPQHFFRSHRLHHHPLGQILGFGCCMRGAHSCSIA